MDDDDFRSEEWARSLERLAASADRCVLAFKHLNSACTVVALELREAVVQARGEETPSHEIADAALARAKRVALAPGS